MKIRLALADRLQTATDALLWDGGSLRHVHFIPTLYIGYATIPDQEIESVGKYIGL